MQTKNDTSKPETELKQEAGEGCQERLVSGSFTPGPWQYNGKTDVYDSTGATVCELYKGYETRPDKRANAILIAAAPDMLAALERIVNAFDAGRNVEGHCICDARAAIELAHGNFSYANETSPSVGAIEKP